MQKLFAQLEQTIQSGRPAVLVTVVASSGSTPRGAGARMLVTKAGRVCGTIGGGAVEHAAEQEAQKVLQTGQSRLGYYQLRQNQVQDLGMICGGDVHVFFRYVPGGDEAMLALAQAVGAAFQKGETAWLITDITPEGQGGMALYAGGTLTGTPVPPAVLHALGPGAAQAEAGGGRYYCEVLVQAGQVYIFGGGHVSQALVPALSAVGFRCIVLEDRPEFCRAELFPGVIATHLIDNARIADFVHIAESDYVVIMTRGHKDDEAVQAQVLRTPARYIGVIGSRRKTAGVFANLRAQGFCDADLARITTPIGLDIGAETPEEIAVSITAQLIQHRAQHRAGG